MCSAYSARWCAAVIGTRHSRTPGRDLGDAAALVEGDERDDLDVDAVAAPAPRRGRRCAAGRRRAAGGPGSWSATSRRSGGVMPPRELLDDAVPGHRGGALARGRAHAPRLAPARPQARRSPPPAPPACGSTTRPGDAVGDQLGRPARVGAGDHRLAREHRLERDEPEVLELRDEGDGARARVEVGELARSPTRPQNGTRGSPAASRAAAPRRARCRRSAARRARSRAASRRSAARSASERRAG